MRREQRHENRSRRGRYGDPHRDWWDEGEGFDRRLREVLDKTSRALRRAQLTEAQLRECAAILDEAFERIRQTLKTPDEQPHDH
jgi:hypothetical protein